MALDLSGVPAACLTRLRDGVLSGRIAVPVTNLALEAEALGELATHVDQLAALNRDGLVAVVDVALAERAAAARSAELVWTGPDGRAGESRDTAAVVQQLFARARRTVTIAGYRFDHGAALLRELHGVMRDHGVTCRIFGDESDAAGLVRANWPFGPPFPEVFEFVPPEGVFASLHAKCLVVDQRHVLVTSANFTERGHERNVEVGVLLDDQALAYVLEGQLSRSLERGVFARVASER